MRMTMFLAPVLAVLLAGPVAAQSADRDLRRAQEVCFFGLLQQTTRPPEVAAAPRPLRNARGEVVGAEMLLRQIGQRDLVLCRYDNRSRKATYERWRGPVWETPIDKPALALTREVCERAVRRRDYRNIKVLSQADVLDRQGRAVARLVAIDARREGRDWRVNCTYDFRSRETRLEALRR